MKAIVRRLIKEEGGQALLLAVILLLVAGLAVGSLLSFMGTGLLVGRVYEKRTAELYAADAGVEDAVWRIQRGETPVCPADPYWSYNITDVNGKRLQVSITYVDAGVFRVTSTAITADAGNTAAILSSTTVESYVLASFPDFSSLLDNAIVSENSITVYNGVQVTGNITSGGTVDDKTKEGDINGTVTQDAELNWPSATDLSSYYLGLVDNAVHYDGDTLLDLEGVSCPPGPIYRTIDGILEAVYWPDGLGPLKVNGMLDITSSDQAKVVTLILNDTLYITGDTKIYGPNANTPYRLNIDLNGQTIFVKSSTSGAKNALEVKDCTIVGSGCIIAVGDVYFAPKGDVGSEDDFVLIMSVEGTVALRPSGTFYGCVAGDLSVEVQSGEDATIINAGLSEGGDLNFPMGVIDPNELPPVSAVNIESWEVTQQ